MGQADPLRVSVSSFRDGLFLLFEGVNFLRRERGLWGLASIPVLFGILTTDDHAQALSRAGEGKDNKGYEATLAALEMVDVYRSLGGR